MRANVRETKHIMLI